MSLRHVAREVADLMMSANPEDREEGWRLLRSLRSTEANELVAAYLAGAGVAEQIDSHLLN